MPNSSEGSLVFETALGFVGIGWSANGLTRVCLFDREKERVERRLKQLDVTSESHQVVPDWIATLVRDIKAYALGEEVDFSSVPVDLAGVDDFRLAIYDAARRLRFGETTTYGELAKRAGQPGLPRETGQALGANPVPLVIPCHRILAAGGKIGGFSAPGGTATKAKMLALEGVAVEPAAVPQRSFAF
ncbi:MAG: methylated-DNA--[protein]-cysteine S-methyltransferase [Mesorhizobium sp.]|nr:methylated-DNA--[protein]-cysteine S-methyltransferase [Mesorhizobium sp.]MBL8577046.1 methylated-DNA--[protein]-cysteine S-methyltransferase [Mesorhizobium sp.]